MVKRLDKEIAAVTADVKDAWKAYKSTKDPEDKQHYEDLKERLDTRRAELEAKLPGPGERSMLISPTFANGHGKAPHDDAAGTGSRSGPERHTL